jgi:hypothetical protein
VRPGAYAFAVYLDARDNSTGASLIVNADSPGTLLRVSAERESSNGSGTDTVWWIAGAAVLIAVVAGAVVVRRRESR